MGAPPAAQRAFTHSFIDSAPICQASVKHRALCLAQGLSSKQDTNPAPPSSVGGDIKHMQFNNQLLVW